MGMLFSLAVLVTIGVVGWRRFGSNDRFVEEKKPRMVASHGDIDGAWSRLRCRCGGRYALEGEGPRGTSHRVVVRCHGCGRRRALLFDVAN